MKKTSSKHYVRLVGFSVAGIATHLVTDLAPDLNQMMGTGMPDQLFVLYAGCLNFIVWSLVGLEFWNILLRRKQ